MTEKRKAELRAGWVAYHIAKMDEDKFYSSIGAYDPENWASYVQTETQRLTEIVAKFPSTEEEEYYFEITIGAWLAGQVTVV